MPVWEKHAEKLLIIFSFFFYVPSTHIPIHFGFLHKIPFPCLSLDLVGQRLRQKRGWWWWQQPPHTPGPCLLWPPLGRISLWQLSLPTRPSSLQQGSCLSQEGESIPLFLCKQRFLLVFRLKSLWLICHSSPLSSQKEKQKIKMMWLQLIGRMSDANPGKRSHFFCTWVNHLELRC